MLLKTTQKIVELKYKTKRIVNITRDTKYKSLEELYFDAMSKYDVEALAKIIMYFGEDKDTGFLVFDSTEEKDVEAVYDFIDDYMQENKKSYEDVFKEIAEDINNQGFFNKKMTKEELSSKISNYITLDLNKAISDATQKAVSDFVENEMKISKG